MRSSVTESEANTTPYPPPVPLCGARRHMAPSTMGAAGSGDEVAGVEALGKEEGEGTIGCGGAEETAANGIGVRA
uniref:DUF834 domain-containing protein n=1 Tax=Oryza meridionalis TaxID=40149 RepID=A0A0E0E3E1_9ORYZ